MPELKSEVVTSGFNKPGLKVINERQALETWLSQQDYSNAVILFMSSGNYDGFDVAAFAKKITETAI